MKLCSFHAGLLSQALNVDQPLRLSFFVFRTTALFAKVKSSASTNQANSIVISAKVGGLAIANLSTPVQIYLSLNNVSSQ